MPLFAVGSQKRPTPSRSLYAIVQVTKRITSDRMREHAYLFSVVASTVAVVVATLSYAIVLLAVRLLTW